MPRYGLVTRCRYCGHVAVRQVELMLLTQPVAAIKSRLPGGIRITIVGKVRQVNPRAYKKSFTGPDLVFEVIHQFTKCYWREVGEVFRFIKEVGGDIGVEGPHFGEVGFEAGNHPPIVGSSKFKFGLAIDLLNGRISIEYPILHRCPGTGHKGYTGNLQYSGNGCN